VILIIKAGEKEESVENSKSSRRGDKQTTEGAISRSDLGPTKGNSSVMVSKSPPYKSSSSQASGGCQQEQCWANIVAYWGLQ
jgi:hypothetical protein